MEIEKGNHHWSLKNWHIKFKSCGRYVSCARIKHNLLSISQLCDKGNKVIFTAAGVKVKRMDTKEIVLTAKRYKNVYKADLMAVPGPELTCLSTIETDPLLWHRRLGHASLK